MEFFQPSYTASSVRWSPSGWWNLAFFWSACACFSLGLREEGTGGEQGLRRHNSREGRGGEVAGLRCARH